MRASRIVVAGPSGSGKTTLAARIGAATGIPHTEIDALHWRAGWTANPRFVDDVAALASGETWVTEFQYSAALPILAARADLLVLLQPPRPVVLARVVRRTVRRRVRRELLWGVVHEAPLRSVLSDPDHIVRWSMRTFHLAGQRARASAAANPGPRVLVVRRRGDADRLIRALAPFTR